MPVTAYTPRDYDGLDVGVGHIPGFFDTLNALIAQSNANEVAAGAHETRHGEGGADPLSSLPSAAILGASAHTIANVITYLDTNPAPMRYQGAIALPADFPDPLVVQAGDLYTCTANVTDNDPTKTNTGLSFLAGDEIAWNGATWDNLGTLRAHAATHASGGADAIADLAGTVTIDAGAHTLDGLVRLDTAPALVVQPEVANVISIPFQSPVPVSAQWCVEVFPEPLLEVNTAAFSAIEAGVGAPVSPPAGRHIFLTDGTGAAQIDVTDVVGASATICWVRFTPLHSNGDVYQQAAPVETAITFDAV